MFFKEPSVMWYVTCMTHCSAFTVDGTFNKRKLIPVLKKEQLLLDSGEYMDVLT